MVDNLQLLKSSESNEWYTPKEHLLLVREVLGNIDLDPASSEVANEFVKADMFFTEKDGSLSYDLNGYTWNGTVYCNPPYGGLAGKFSQKMKHEYESGRVTAGILCLSGYAYETKWFRPFLSDLSIPICWVYGRVKFSRYVDGRKDLENKASTVGTIYVYLGPDNQKFAETFSQIGAIR